LFTGAERTLAAGLFVLGVTFVFLAAVVYELLPETTARAMGSMVYPDKEQAGVAAAIAAMVEAQTDALVAFSFFSPWSQLLEKVRALGRLSLETVEDVRSASVAHNVSRVVPRASLRQSEQLICEGFKLCYMVPTLIFGSSGFQDPRL